MDIIADFIMQLIVEPILGGARWLGIRVVRLFSFGKVDLDKHTHGFKRNVAYVFGTFVGLTVFFLVIVVVLYLK